MGLYIVDMVDWGRSFVAIDILLEKLCRLHAKRPATLPGIKLY